MAFKVFTYSVVSFQFFIGLPGFRFAVSTYCCRVIVHPQEMTKPIRSSFSRTVYALIASFLTSHIISMMRLPVVG